MNSKMFKLNLFENTDNDSEYDEAHKWKTKEDEDLEKKLKDEDLGDVEVNHVSADYAKKALKGAIKLENGSITVDQYNQAISQLQRSFKEGAELLAALQEATIVEKSIDELQNEFVEEAILTAYTDGPYFEAVKDEDKDTVKAIVKDIRKPVIETLKKNGINVDAVDKTGNASEIWKGILWGSLVGLQVPLDIKRNIASRSYQTLCAIICNAKVKTNTLTQLNKLYAEELQGYKIKAFAIRKSSAVNKDDDDEDNRYILYVDQTDQENKEFQKAFMDLNKFIGDSEKAVKE